MTTHTGQSEALDDLKTATPSVFSVKEILLGLLKNECFLNSRPVYTSEMLILEWYNTSFFWYVSCNNVCMGLPMLCKIT